MSGSKLIQFIFSDWKYNRTLQMAEMVSLTTIDYIFLISTSLTIQNIRSALEWSRDRTASTNNSKVEIFFHH